MLARRELPEAYAQWNAQHGAPFGRRFGHNVPQAVRRLPGVAQAVGMFAFQTNTVTRAYEYPWAFEALEIVEGMTVLEIGGGNSGFQFALEHAGAHVTNIDPGTEARGRGWPVSEASIDQLNRRFGTSVTLANCFIDEAGLADESFDRAVSISTIEHIPAPDIETILQEIRRVLVPGGCFVLTLDLFLDVEPFTDSPENEYGSNVSVAWMEQVSGLRLVQGERAELCGYDEFDPEAIMAKRSEYLEGAATPQLVQTAVLARA